MRVAYGRVRRKTAPTGEVRKSYKTKMFMLLLIVTHFKAKKGALFCCVYNFQIVKRLSIRVSNPQVESPI